MRRDHPQQRDPLIKDLGRAPQDLTTGNQNVKRRTAATFEKVVHVLEQTYRIRCGELGNRVGSNGPCISRNAACARSESPREIEGGVGYIGVLK